MPLIRKPPASQASPVLESLSAALTDLTQGTVDERWAAARVAASAPGGIAALGLALSFEQDSRVREAIFTSLARTQSDEGLREVLRHLRSDDANLRTGALDALRTMPGPVADHLDQMLADPDSDVRLLACELARSVPAEAGLPALEHLLETDAQATVCGAAVEVLVEIGTADLVPALIRCAARFPDDPFLGFAVKMAAERLSQRPTQ